jgi:hypothetical protein
MNTLIRQRWLWGTTVVMLAAGVTYGCKDFLTLPAQGTLNEDVLTTGDGVEASLIATYRVLDCGYGTQITGWGCAASNWVWGSVTSGDAYKGSNLGDQQPVNDVETFNWGASDVDGYLNEKWSQMYEGVSRANNTIRLLNKVMAKKPGEISDENANGIRGEAIFLRAHYHFEAYRMWGHIPYYREADTTDYRLTNTGVDALAEILTDLDEAIGLLPAIPRHGDKGRATVWTAKAYKGRVQMYKGDYAGAVTTFTDVKNNGPYALETSFDHVWTAFAQYQDGPETILAYQASVRDGEPNGENSNFGERLNFPHSGSHFGCCGFHQPSQNLVNFFAVDVNGLPLAITDPLWNTTHALSDTDFVATRPEAVDPRLDWTVGRQDVPYKDWGLYTQAWTRDVSYSGPYSPKKNIHEQAADGENNVGWVPSQTNDVHIHIFRYADLLLLLAEAQVEQNNLAGALAIVNSIRARAGQTAQGCGSDDAGTLAKYPTCAGNTAMAVPLTLAGSVYSLTEPWATYRIGLYPSFPSQAYARRAVQYERRLELAMEGQRFFDLRRLGAADTAVANYIAVEKTRRIYLTLAVPFAAKHHLYPLPSIQIDLSKVGTETRLQQNDGW